MAIVIRVQKGIKQSLSEFQDSKEQLSRLSPSEKTLYNNTINILEREIRRLEKYINLLADIKLPET